MPRPVPRIAQRVRAYAHARRALGGVSGGRGVSVAEGEEKEEARSRKRDSDPSGHSRNGQRSPVCCVCRHPSLPLPPPVFMLALVTVHQKRAFRGPHAPRHMHIVGLSLMSETCLCRQLYPRPSLRRIDFAESCFLARRSCPAAPKVKLLGVRGLRSLRASHLQSSRFSM